jgi:hypothetical protein
LRGTLAFARHGKRVEWCSVDVVPRPASAGMQAGDGDLLDALLEEFATVFHEPQGLPPQCCLCHRIRLKAGISAVVIPPHRYTHLQKDELERQCDVMLRTGVIRHSTSAFSSLVLLVRKKDGSWHFCVNYRALNVTTVKDKFPIPVVKELLDELSSGADARR